MCFAQHAQHLPGRELHSTLRLVVGEAQEVILYVRVRRLIWSELQSFLSKNICFFFQLISSKRSFPNNAVYLHCRDYIVVVFLDDLTKILSSFAILHHWKCTRKRRFLLKMSAQTRHLLEKVLVEGSQKRDDTYGKYLYIATQLYLCWCSNVAVVAIPTSRLG